MKTYQAKNGPFTERPFYTLEEVEQLCVEELENAGLFPKVPEPIRIDRFIEKRFKVYPVYESLPEGVLGCIEFDSKGVKGVVVSRALSEEDSKIAERRINTTLAHEAGHGLLHAHLFVLAQKSESLFGKDFDPNKPKILCRSDAIQGIPDYKDTGRNHWWEYQANLVIGPLLLPRSLVMTSLEPFLVKKGIMGNQILDRNCKEDAVRMLSQTFDVNPIVAKIRLETLFPERQDSQLTF